MDAKIQNYINLNEYINSNFEQPIKLMLSSTTENFNPMFKFHKKCQDSELMRRIYIAPPPKKCTQLPSLYRGQQLLYKGTDLVHFDPRFLFL